MDSRHYREERKERERIINEIIGIGEKVATFKVDRGHRNGPELHTITTTGIVIIENERTHKLVTKLIARPAQIKRYFGDDNSPQVKQILKLAKEHNLMGYNEF